MGAYSPAPIVTPDLHARIMREVIDPALRGLALDGTPYLGFLYAGLMIGADGIPYVLEFNCRLGDPETQPILMRLESDLVSLCGAAVRGCLAGTRGEMGCSRRPRRGDGCGRISRSLSHRRSDRRARRGRALPGKVFHAGTRASGPEVLTAGGRVLCAVGLGEDIADAQREAYELVHAIHWDGVQYRRDIGRRAIAAPR